MFCTKCHAENNNDDKYCWQCGYPLQGEPTKTVNKIIIIGVVIFCLLIRIMFFLLLSNKRDRSIVTYNPQQEEVADNGQNEENITEEVTQQEKDTIQEEEYEPTETQEEDTYAEEEIYPQDNSQEDEIQSEPLSDYILPDSSIRILADSEMQSLTKEELRLARNEIYARHGRRFDDQNLQDYFEQKAWYVGSIDPEDFKESWLSNIEKQNIKTIEKYEG